MRTTQPPKKVPGKTELFTGIFFSKVIINTFMIFGNIGTMNKGGMASSTG
jgi:hypothetical protein